VAVNQPPRPPCTISAETIHRFCVGHAPRRAVSVHFLGGVRTLSESEFNKMIAEGLAQAKANQGLDLDNAFDRLRVVLGDNIR